VFFIANGRMEDKVPSKLKIFVIFHKHVPILKAFFGLTLDTFKIVFS